MIAALLGLGAIGLVLMVSELLWNKGIMRGEVSRKFVHIIVGAFVASWPVFMPRTEIQLLSFILLLGVLVSKGLKLFDSVHTVPRRTWVEILFPVGVGLAATFAHSDLIFTAAVLHMGVADGLAAIVGTKLLHTKGYKIFGQRKTYIGSLTFFTAAFAITTWYAVYSGIVLTSASWTILIWLPLAATYFENVSVFGTDNLLVPILVVAVLNVF
jgi:phytol kinase